MKEVAITTGMAVLGLVIVLVIHDNINAGKGFKLPSKA